MSALRRQLLWAGVGTTLITAALIKWVDIPLALFFEGQRETWWVTFFETITDFASGWIWYSIALLGILAAYVRYKRRMPDQAAFMHETRAWMFMIVTMAASGIFINALKLAIGRERPRLLFRDGTSNFHPFGLSLSDCGFPSGHTQSIWTAMLALGFICPPLRPVFFVVAVLISASRVIIGAHYAGDVVAGLYIAVIFALLWQQWFERHGISVTLYPRKQMLP
jgi:membrane-associated phospholipid phosphatase